LVASNHEPTVNAAIDNAKDELMRQLRQDKKLHSRLWRKSGAFAKRLLRLE
jgi:ribosome-associated translation inhibitor RaiA